MSQGKVRWSTVLCEMKCSGEKGRKKIKGNRRIGWAQIQKIPVKLNERRLFRKVKGKALKGNEWKFDSEKWKEKLKEKWMKKLN